MRCTCPPALIYEIYINLPAGAPTMNAAIEPFERPALNDCTGGAGEEISVNIQYNQYRYHFTDCKLVNICSISNIPNIGIILAIHIRSFVNIFSISNLTNALIRQHLSDLHLFTDFYAN